MPASESRRTKRDLVLAGGLLKKNRSRSLFYSVDETGPEIERLYRDRYVRFRNGVAPVAGGYEAARDAVQEGFARALRSTHQYSGRGSLEGWVWRIVLRTALEQRRTSEREEFSLDEVEFALVEPERDLRLAHAVRALPPRRRLIVFLRYFADLPYQTIADALEIDVGMVAATLAQARQELAVILDNEGVRP
jgi:RNA polymerase sigma-70 factor (ECF subfamily)